MHIAPQSTGSSPSAGPCLILLTTSAALAANLSWICGLVCVFVYAQFGRVEKALEQLWLSTLTRLAYTTRQLRFQTLN